MQSIHTSVIARSEHTQLPPDQRENTVIAIFTGAMLLLHFLNEEATKQWIYQK